MGLLIGAARAAEQPGAAEDIASASEAAETWSQYKDLKEDAAKAFAGVRDALAARDEAGGLDLAERYLRIAWMKGKAMEMDLNIARMEKSSQVEGEHDAQTLVIVKKMAKRIEALEIENKALRERLGEKSESLSERKPATGDGMAKPPLKIDDLLAAARDYVAQPAGETQAARDARQESIRNRLVGREFLLVATLREVKRQKEDGTFTVTLQWESSKQMLGRTWIAGAPGPQKMVPSETVFLKVITTDSTAMERSVGERVTVRARLAKSGFANRDGPLEVQIEGEEGRLSR
jgi:hypothetical protein